MQVRLAVTFKLTDEERKALAYRADGGVPSYDKPTGRKASREEILDLFQLWLANELSETRNAYDDAVSNFQED